MKPVFFTILAFVDYSVSRDAPASGESVVAVYQYQDNSIEILQPLSQLESEM